MNRKSETYKFINLLLKTSNLDFSSIELKKYLENQPYVEDLLIVQDFLETQKIDTLF